MSSTFPRNLRFFLIVIAAAGCASAPGGASAGDVVLADNRGSSTEPIEVVLQRQSPGLLISRTDGGEIAARLRAPTSSYNGAESIPLYVLDGQPFTAGAGGSLVGINPQDIASIKLLRASEAGLYGINGSNGVIVVTTKKPTR